jgi:hypothetical protein
MPIIKTTAAAITAATQLSAGFTAVLPKVPRASCEIAPTPAKISPSPGYSPTRITDRPLNQEQVAGAGGWWRVGHKSCRA